MLNAQEEALVNAFVVRQKRERILGMLGSGKGRKKLLRELPHFKDLDVRFVQSISPINQPPHDILRILIAKGAGSACRVISENPDLDGKEMLLSEALEKVVGRGYGTLLSCIPSRLGYYEGEDTGRRFVLERPVSP